MEIDKEVFNIMLVESMHQIVRIEFRNAKFPYTELGGSAPFQPPPGGAAPWIPVFVTNFTAPRWKQSWISGGAYISFMVVKSI